MENQNKEGTTPSTESPPTRGLQPDGSYVTDFHGTVYTIPAEDLIEALDYVELGKPPGNFLEAVIKNNLTEAVFRSDARQLALLPAWLMFFYWEPPAPCWGSAERMKEWSQSMHEMVCGRRANLKAERHNLQRYAITSAEQLERLEEIERQLRRLNGRKRGDGPLSGILNAVIGVTRVHPVPVGVVGGVDDDNRPVLEPENQDGKEGGS